MQGRHEEAALAWQRGQAYGQDLRDRVLAASGSIREVAKRFAVSDSYVARARSKRRRAGNERAGVQCGHVPRRLAGLEPALAAQVALESDQTLSHLCDWVQREHDVRVGITTMWKTLARLGLSFKKRLSTPASKSAQT